MKNRSQFRRREPRVGLVGVSALALVQPLAAQTAATNSVTTLPTVVVTGRADSLVGVADSASSGVVGRDHLQARPILRPGELLETVPGVVITQHSGAGKANQYFLRGFNLDHGTDLATSLDGMPINLPTHGHGQGYTDLNFIIPELVDTIDFRHGAYAAQDGDFSSAGSIDLHYANTLPENFVTLEGGSFDHVRLVSGGSGKAGPGQLLYGVELYHNDGPWQREDDYRKLNGLLRYSQGDESLGWSLTGMAYHGDWNATDQVARRAVDAGLIDRFGTLDPTSGGDSQRHALQGEWHRADDRTETRVMGYGFYYDLDLFSNFTYLLGDAVNGDQFEQVDERVVGGLKASHLWRQEWFGKPVENTVGLQFRADGIENGLHTTTARQRTGTVRQDDVFQASFAPYLQNRIAWGEKFRTVAGLRGDLYRFDVSSDNPANSGREWDGIASPKLQLIFGPWAETEFYVSGGLGFHSNDGRGSTTTIDPGTGNPVDPVDPLVRTYGAEFGVRTTWVPGLQSTVSFWWLDIDSELLFIGDAGNTEASRPSRRYGVEFANYYRVNEWVTLDADLSLSHARFRDNDPAGDHIPGAIQSVLAAGATLHDWHGFFGSVRLRYFGPRPLVEDDSVRSNSTLLLNAQAGYRFNKTWAASVTVFNLLDREDSDIEYYYPSLLPGEAPGPDDGGYNDIHFHPVEPISVRVALTAKF